MPSCRLSRRRQTRKDDHPAKVVCRLMRTSGHKLNLRLFAAIVAVAATISSHSALLMFIADFDASCSMVCCVREGFCCCNPGPYAEKRGDGSRDRFLLAELQSKCPEGCIPVRLSIRTYSNDLHRDAFNHNLDLAGSALCRESIVWCAISDLILNLSPPRAPPSLHQDNPEAGLQAWT
jgi:hypothetical protein